MKKVRLLIAVALLLGAVPAWSQYSVLHNFNDTAGSFPISSLTQAGNVLYGLTGTGGANACQCGCIFSIHTDGTGYRDMHDFGGISDTDGNNPVGKLALAGNRLYGMTGNGMASTGGNDCTTCGMIFAIDTDGTGYTKLYNFGDNVVLNCSSGCQPGGSLIYADSVLYGMATGGPSGDGVIFSMNLSGTVYDTLMTFNGANGSVPTGSLALSGNVLYGMTSMGGPSNLGCIFSIHTDGSGFDTLMSFNGLNGSKPIGSPAVSGNVLYGMTEYGDSSNSGNIFSINTNGTGFRSLRNFANSENPQGDLTISGGTMYGMTNGGGANLYGCIFSIDTNGSAYTDLFDFCHSSCNDSSGINPQGDLTLSGNALYGMTYGGGTNGEGVIFKLDTNTTTGINERTAGSMQVKIYPNPNEGRFSYVLAQPGATMTTPPKIYIYNATGEIVWQSNISAGFGEINLSHPVQGVYMYRMVTTDEKLLDEGKFIVQ